MGEVVNTILQQYGMVGILIVLIACLSYLIYGDRKNNWGQKIDNLGAKIDNMESKIDWVETRMSARVSAVEDKITNSHEIAAASEHEEAKKQTLNIMSTGQGGKLSKILRYYCKRINCNHIFLGGFHNGTTDLRGLHYCKFDILIDEFADPLHIHPNDTDFQPLYKDENVIAYGDLPYKLTHVDSTVFDVEDPTFFEMSDTLYRRCKSRDIKKIGFAIIRDNDGFPTGFIGCISFDDQEMLQEDMKACAHEIENIYSNN